MIAFFSEHLATIVVGLAVAALFFLAVRHMLRQHKEGKCPGGCGGNCGTCGGCGHHQRPDPGQQKSTPVPEGELPPPLPEAGETSLASSAWETVAF